jgi:hypothetical protein
MKSRSTIAKIALAAGAAATLTALVPAAASAQGYYGGYDQRSYDARSGYYYDPCRRDESNRSVGGGLAGAVAGAVIGGNVASRKVRDEGAILGGVLGAVVGSQIGKSTAACSPQNRDYGYNSGYGYGQNGYYGSAYGQPYYGSPYDARPYEGRRYQQRRYNDRRYDDRYDDYSYNDSYYGSSTGYGGDCRMVESTIRLPDGRRETRMVQTCRDSRGNYQLVD